MRIVHSVLAGLLLVAARTSTADAQEGSLEARAESGNSF
jgi:hypothetical protein